MARARVKCAYSSPAVLLRLGAVLIAAYVVAWFAIGLGAMLIAIAVTVVTLPLGSYWEFRQQAERIARSAGTGTVLTSQFGPQAVDFQYLGQRVRISYARIHRILVEPDVIILHHGRAFTAFPRELFPDHTISYLRRTRPRRFLNQAARATLAQAPTPPLEPIPAMSGPSVVVMAGPETAGELARAYVGRPTRELGRAMAILSPLLMTALWLSSGVGAVVAGVLILAVSALAYMVWISMRLRRVRTVFAGYASDGQSLSARFTETELEIQVAIFRTTWPHTAIEQLECRDAAVVIQVRGTTFVFPRELFPDPEIERIRAAIPEPIIRH
ncbi:hypothetical protein GCM10027167_10910 [Nocardia heshunensis]